jgi:hypothetical protein
MDELQNRFKSRGIRESTAKIYITYLNRISSEINGKLYNSNEFLKDSDKIIIYLNTQTISIQKNMVSAIMVAITKSKLHPLNGFAEAYDVYNSYLKGLYSATAIPQGQKNLKECNNWVEWGDILKIVSIKAKIIKSMGLNSSSKAPINKANFELLQQYVILSIYTMLPPKRLEYGDMLIIGEIDYNKLTDIQKQQKAYLVVFSKVKKYFTFGKDTQKSYHSIHFYEKIDIPKNLNSVLNIWLNYNHSKYLLLNESGDILTRNGLTRALLRIFEPYGKSISSQMLRKIFLSNENRDLFERQAKEAEISRKMNHSRKTAEAHYVKH